MSAEKSQIDLCQKLRQSVHSERRFRDDIWEWNERRKVKLKHVRLMLIGQYITKVIEQHLFILYSNSNISDNCIQLQINTLKVIMVTCNPSSQQPYHDQPTQTLFTPGSSLGINQQPLTMCASNNTFSHQPSYTAPTGHELEIVNETDNP